MDQQLFDRVFVGRSVSLQADLTDVETDHTGWIGGNAPAWFDDRALQVPEGERYGFYMTVRLPFCEDMCSVFLPRRFDSYNQNNIYPDCAIRVVRHPVGEESKKALYPLLHQPPALGEKPTRYQRSLDYSRPILKKTWLSSFSPVEEAKEKRSFVQMGGQPLLIQDEDYYTKALERDGYRFLMQVDEDFYSDDLVYGNYPFCYGALYIYAKLADHQVGDIVAGFWQH